MTLAGGFLTLKSRQSDIMDTVEWNEFTKLTPQQGQRVLVKRPGMSPFIVDYNRFIYALWSLTHWKPLPGHDSKALINKDNSKENA